MTKEKYHHGDLKQALIESGRKILHEYGVNALTLRSTARAAGVSHSAPYAHFTDKQALLAAISTQGFLDLQERLSQNIEKYRASPRDLLIETGWGYIQFALSEPACFKLMFSGILEDEHSHPEFMAAVRKTYQMLVNVVAACQKKEILPAGPADETAVAVWSLVHGFVALHLERQIPGQVLEKRKLKELFANSLGLLMLG